MSADHPDQRPSPCDHDDEIAELRGQVAAHERALTDEVVRGHLEGRDTIGLYPQLVGDTCRLLVCDFDKPSHHPATPDPLPLTPNRGRQCLRREVEVGQAIAPLALPSRRDVSTAALSRRRWRRRARSRDASVSGTGSIPGCRNSEERERYSDLTHTVRNTFTILPR